jgi:cobalt-zinc-cadmium efflux system outer membrane protein
MKNAIIYGVLIFLGWGASCSAQSLPSILEMVGENNPRIKAAYLQFEMSLERVAQYNALPDPTLSFGYFIMPVETRVGSQQARLSLSQMFPWFGSLKAKGDALSLQAEATYNDFLNTKHEVYLSAKESYYTIWEIQRQVELKKENLAVLKSLEKLTNQTFADGKTAMTDIIKLELMIERNKTDIILLENREQALMAKITALLNNSLQASKIDTRPHVDTTIASIHIPIDSILLNPRLVSIDKKMSSATAHTKWVKKNSMPKLGLGVDYVFVGNENGFSGQDALMPMVSMSLPIFRKKYRASIKESELLSASLVHQKSNLQNELNATFIEASTSLENSLRLIELLSRQIEDSKRLISLLTTAYSTSGNDFEEILRIQREIIDYKMKHVSSLRAAHIATSKLEYLTGKPL